MHLADQVQRHKVWREGRLAKGLCECGAPRPCQPCARVRALKASERRSRRLAQEGSDTLCKTCVRRLRAP